jgi:hypothetical protein
VIEDGPLVMWAAHLCYERSRHDSTPPPGAPAAKNQLARVVQDQRMVWTSVRRFGVLALVAGLAGCGGSGGAKAQPAASATVDTVETGAGVYAAPKDLPALCQQLDYTPFKDSLTKTAAKVNVEPVGRDMQSEVGVTCTQTFTGAVLVSGNVLTTIYFYADVALAKKMYQAERAPGSVEPGTLTDVHGAGAEASRYLGNDNPYARILNLTARRSNATVTVRVVLQPAEDVTTGDVDTLFTSVASYADKELNALKGTAAR